MANEPTLKGILSEKYIERLERLVKKSLIKKYRKNQSNQNALKGKLLFAAAGTSFSWTSWWGVIYPAYYSQCVAVTGVKENGNTCSDCHDGSQVDLTIPMARNTSSSRTTLSLPMSGYNPKYVGGSSCATALTAGVAALVWSVNPNLTATQVLTCMKGTAQFYPNLSSSKGYGNVNAYAAVMMASGM